MKYSVLLYYKYIHISDPAQCLLEQRALCETLELKGRIIIAEEGINGTVEGTLKATRQYMRTMKRDPHFADIHWKISEGTGSAFPKLSIKVRSEIVSGQLKENDINPTRVTGTYLTPEELHEWFETGREFYIVDMRNDYEHRVGHFKGSILPPLENFRDLPKVLPTIEHLRDKPVLTVCTGGVRCEKASGLLKTQGFANVYQLQGGIVSYMEKYPNTQFQGKLYVFDNRIVMSLGDEQDPAYVTVGRCELCAQPCERYVNCANLMCHKHFICCTTCAPHSESAFCSQACALRVTA